jgi:hypothetical protein
VDGGPLNSLWFFLWGSDLFKPDAGPELYFLRQRFFTMLLVPIVIVWGIAAGLVPALRWVIEGFRK